MGVERGQRPAARSLLCREGVVRAARATRRLGLNDLHGLIGSELLRREPAAGDPRDPRARPSPDIAPPMSRVTSSHTALRVAPTRPGGGRRCTGRPLSASSPEASSCVHTTTSILPQCCWHSWRVLSGKCSQQQTVNTQLTPVVQGLVGVFHSRLLDMESPFP